MSTEALILFLIGFNLFETTFQTVLIDEHPKSSNVTQYESVTLGCKFNTKVHCTWRRNNDKITVNGRYTFLRGHDGKSTTDCSLRITSVRKDFDEGSWTCSFQLTDYQADGTHSEPAKLFISEKALSIAVPNLPADIPVLTTTVNNLPDDKVDTLIIAVAAIAGIVVIIIVIIVVIVWCHCRKKKAKAIQSDNSLCKRTSALQQVRYPDPVMQPMLFLSRGQNVYDPDQVVCANTSLIGMVPVSNPTNNYLMPIIPTAPLAQTIGSKSSGKQVRREKPKYENVVNDDHLYDEIDDV